MQADHKISDFCFYSLALIISFFVIAYPPHNVLAYDVFGYYMYLPLSFKYHDLTIHDYATLDKLMNIYYPSETFYQAVKWDNGNWVMRYPIGLSILYAPFYFIADFIAPYTSYKADGFSQPYQLSILYGCLFYTLVGLHFIKKTLLLFISDGACALTLLCIGIGTNYFLHVAIHGQGAMSHNILFSLYAITFYLTIKWHQTYSIKYIILLGITIGITALCRASEIICLIIPVMYGITNKQSLHNKIALLLKYKTQILIFTLIIIGIGFIQFGYWKYSSGHFFINPYGSGNPGEGFEFTSPHILKVLFSFRKGWFIYSPLMLLAMYGLWRLYKDNKILFACVSIYFFINLYIVSSWSCWWYGSCFGNRALIASYSTLCIPLGYAIDHILKNKFKYVFFRIMIILIGFNLFQSWQMSEGILDSTNMSRDYYFSTFFQTNHPNQAQTNLLLKGKFNNGVEVFTKEDSVTHSLSYMKGINFEKENINPKFLCDSLKHSGKYSLRTNPKTISSYSIEVKHETLTKKSYTWIKASVWVYSVYPADSLDATFTIQLKHKGYIFKPKDYKLNSTNFKPNVWNKLEYYYLTPDDLRSTKDVICVAFSNKGKNTIYIDDLSLQSYEPIVDKSVF